MSIETTGMADVTLVLMDLMATRFRERFINSVYV
jgi:hypothetical protein